MLIPVMQCMSLCLLFGFSDNMLEKISYKVKLFFGRQCVRRQSARLKSQEPEPADGLSEVELNSLASGPLHNDRMEEDFSKSSTVTIEVEKISGSKRFVRKHSCSSTCFC